ncbi:hypothetical protein [Luteimonas aquatica]|uniref:hypothetical protein n=1 Tax=Luteimonas aquatica TaxID=450364 RepID=UPI001F599AC3|nr:hypothetical protein [Luteimonas aquatica]
MMPKAILVGGSALAAFAVSGLGMLACFAFLGIEMRFPRDIGVPGALVLVATASVSICAWLFSRTAAFWRQSPLGQSLMIVAGAYPVFLILIVVVFLLKTALSNEAVDINAVAGASFVGMQVAEVGAIITIVPACLAEFIVMKAVSRSIRIGQPQGAAL